MDYYNNDESFSWVAAHCFTDIHHGRAIAEYELEQRMDLLNYYEEEIGQASEMIRYIPNFDRLDYKDQINFAANLLVSLKDITEKTSKKTK